jgi:hypothetical protein
MAALDSWARERVGTEIFISILGNNKQSKSKIWPFERINLFFSAY